MTLHLLPPPDADGADPDILPSRASDVLDGLVDHLLLVGGPARRSVPTGIGALDDIGGGLRPGTVTAVVSSPDARPTWPLLRAALHAARSGHSTYFYELDLGLGSFAVGMAATVREVDVGPTGFDHVEGSEDLRLAAREVAQLPLRVAVGYAVGIHDILAVTEDEEPVDLIVVDNCDLLLPSGDVRDLKRVATYLDVAVLCSAIRSVGGGCDRLGADLLAAADTLVSCDSDGGCQLVATRMPPEPAR